MSAKVTPGGIQATGELVLGLAGGGGEPSGVGDGAWYPGTEEEQTVII